MNRPATAAPAPRVYRYYDLIMAAFVTVLLCSNLIGASKVCRIGDFTFSAGVLFFPISYIFGDILTEVYGYARMRRVVWAGFASIFFGAFMSWVVLAMPASAEWGHQKAFQTVFGATPRIVVGSLVAYWAGEFCNSYIMAKLKIWTEGRLLFVRTIGSTILGQAVDSIIFYPIAFYGVWPNDILLSVLLGNYLLKVGWEAINTPVTYRVVSFLKQAEQEDYYDRHTDFTPFSLST